LDLIILDQLTYFIIPFLVSFIMEAKLKKMTVVELRKELDKYNLSKTGLKAELIQRLLTHFEENQSKNAQESEDEEEKPVEDSPIKPAASKRFKRVRKVNDSDDEKEKENKENDEEAETKSKTTKAKSKTRAASKNTKRVDDDEETPSPVEQVKEEPVKADIPAAKEVVPERKSDIEASTSSTSKPQPKAEQKTTLEFVPSSSLFHLANDLIFDRSIEFVLAQVHPNLKASLPALKTLRSLITFVIETILKGGAVAIEGGRPAITVESSLKAVRSLIGGDLAKHAEAEGINSIQKYKNAVQQRGHARNSDEDPSAPNDAGLVFPYDLFQNTLKNCCFPTPNVDDECVILFAAFGEYFSAELLELSGNVAGEERRENIIPEHMTAAISRDEEFSKLFSAYSNPYATAKEQEAISQWMYKGRDLIQTLEQLPVEQLSQAIKSITQRIRIMDNTVACREALRQFAQPLPREIAAQVEKVMNSFSLEESTCVQQVFGQTATRTKFTNFSISTPTEVFRFTYNNTIYDLDSDDGRTKLELVVSSPRVNGTVWGNADFGEPYQMNYDVLHQLKIALGINVDDLHFVHCLLILCETDSNGGGIVQSELGTMVDVYNLFDQDQSLHEVEQMEDME